MESFVVLLESVLCIREGRLIKLLSSCLLFCFLLSCALCSADEMPLLSYLGTSLVALVVPISIGMFVNHKWPQKAKIILKVSVPCHRLQSQMLHSVSSNNRSIPATKLVFSLYYKPPSRGT